MQLERKLQDQELCRSALYKILIDAGKAEKLLEKLYQAAGESDLTLNYLKQKIHLITL